MMCYYIWVADSVVAIPSNRDVAQFGSASGLGPEGRRFESCHPDQHRVHAKWRGLYVFYMKGFEPGEGIGRKAKVAGGKF